jgi:hypothetical protein
MPVLHLQDAVLEHAQWWSAFEHFLHSDENAAIDLANRRLEREDVARDDRCAIGRWLHGDGAQFSDLAAYQMVKNLHKELHDLSGMALFAKTQGNLELVQVLIGDIHKIRHDLFMAWDALNDIIGGYD